MPINSGNEPNLTKCECGRQDSNLQENYEGSIPQLGGFQVRCVYRFRHVRVAVAGGPQGLRLGGLFP